MSELEEIRRRKLAELSQSQNQFSQQQDDEEAALLQQIQNMEDMVKPYFSKEALQRYSNIRMAHPEQAIKVLLVLSHGVQQGKLKQVTDDQLKSLLKEFLPKKREFKLTRK